MTLYEIILAKAEYLSPAVLSKLLKEQHIHCLAKFLKRKFPQDPRSVSEMVVIIKEEMRIGRA